MPESTSSVQENVQQVVEDLLPGAHKGIDLSHVLTAVITLVVCLVVVRILLGVLNRFLERSKIEKTLHGFIRSLTRVLLYFLTALIVVGSLGIDVTSLVALMSVVGLALSLALQGTLSNLAGGIMLLVTKPFLVGDYVEIDSTSGVVQEINLVYTKLNTYDNKRISIPNSQVSSARVVNYSTEGNRRVDLTVSASYNAPVDTVKAALQEAIAAQSAALHEPAPFARLSKYGDSAIEYTVRVWCRTDDYWSLYYDLLEEIKRSFDRNGVEMTYPHVNVHIADEP